MNETKFQDELDFKDVLKKPIRLFGFTYFYFLILFFLIGVFYISNLNNLQRNNLVPIIDSVKIDSDLPYQKGSKTEPIDLKKLIKPTSELIQKGKSSYLSNCASCHGEFGKGDGVAGAMLNPKPRNFVTDQRWTNGKKFNEIYLTLEEGITKNGMPAFNYLSPLDRIGLIHFVQTFFDKVPEIDNQVVENLIQQYSLDQPKEIPSQIPIKKAKSMIVYDNIKMNNQIQKIKNEITSSRIPFFEQVSYNPELSIYSLINGYKKFNNNDALKKAIISNVNSNGFNPKIIYLTDSEWDNIINLVKNNI